MNFILYEDDEAFLKSYENIITKLMGKSKINYKIHKISEFSSDTLNYLDNITGNKIYILDVEVPGKNGIDLARIIRKNGDWTSQIIVVTSHEEFIIVGYMKKLLMLDFITKSQSLNNCLLNTLRVALEIILGQRTYKFFYKGEYFLLPYDDILYFEKNLGDNSTLIVCENDDYTVRKNINEIAKELMDTYFFKTHRSCIVNLRKVRKINYDDGIIYFDTDEVNLLSRCNKKALKAKIDQLNEFIL